jgi:putative ABC transport system permease protein
MVKNYLLTALRNIVRNRLFSTINILGLAISVGCTLLIFMWINDELGVDHFHAKSDRIYRVMENQRYSDGRMYTFSSTPAPMAPFVKDKYPEIEKASRFTWEINNLFQVGDKAFYEKGFYADQDFLDIFSFGLREGNASTALKEKNSVVISVEMAHKFFGDESPIGKMLVMSTKDNFMVTGVLDKIPASSSMQFDYLLPFEYFWDENKSWLEPWDNNNVRTYLLLKEGSNVAAFSDKFADEVKAHKEKTNVKFFIQPYRDAYLHGQFEEGKLTGGRIEYVKIFFVVAIFVLLIASINFMNLATAQSAKRAKEVGLRKVIGAVPRQLFRQFMGESFLTVSVASLLGLGIAFLGLPLFNEVAGKNLTFNLLDTNTLLIFLSVVVFTGVLAGSYPAIFMSGFRPVDVLKGQLQSGSRASLLRRALVVTQFSLSIILIISTIVVYRQMKFMQNRDIGFVRDNVFYAWMEGDVKTKFQTFRERLLHEPGLESVTAASQSPIDVGNSTMGVEWEGKLPDEQILFTNLAVDLGFVQTMKMEMVEGRAFDPVQQTDTLNYIVNQKAAAKFGFKNGVANQDLTFWGKKGKIVGVVKDFNFGSLHNPIDPLILFSQPDNLNCMLIRTKPGEAAAAIKATEKLWKEYAPGYPFKYTFLNQDWESFYKSEGQQGQLFNTLAILSIVISCLGLFGLAAYAAERRTKELGIRKVLGASVPGLVRLVGREFTILVMIAAFIGCPIGWGLMNSWLGKYAYRVDVGFVSLVVAAGSCLLISIGTVAYHALRASTANPAKSLRYE